MSRFILTAAVVGAPPQGQYQVFHRGQAVADTIGNSIAGDLVWASLCASPSVANMLPLDAAGLAQMIASGQLPAGSAVTTLAAIAANGSIGGVGIGQQ